MIFVTSALGVIPTAALMGRATEELAARSGPGIGGFLNVTFGNAPELIIAFFALREGLQEVVKASLIGSVLGNMLLVMGAAMFVGGRKRERQRFDRTAAERAVACCCWPPSRSIMPAMFQLVNGGGAARARARVEGVPGDLEHMSIAVSDRAAGHLHRPGCCSRCDPQGPVQPGPRDGRARRRAVDGAPRGDRWRSRAWPSA